MEVVTATERAGFRTTFAAFKYPNYRLWFFGQMISLFGTWMQTTAQGFLVFELTHSSAFLGYVVFAAGMPSWLFMLYGGVVADRVPRRALMIVTQSCLMALAVILAWLTFSGQVQPWQIIALAFLTGTANAFDAPARQAFVLEMVERQDLSNAIALNSTMFNVATALGPAMAGIVYDLFGPGWCFAVNAISYLAVIVALGLMQLKPMNHPAQRNSSMADLQEGLRYVIAHPVIRRLMLLLGCVSLFGMSFVALIPAWSVKILHGDATTNGLLQSARGFGSLLAALFVAYLGNFLFKGKLLAVGAVTFPAMLLLFSVVRFTPLAVLALVGVGAGLILTFNLCNTLVQTLAQDSLRGRVMGVYSFTFFGFLPLGGLLAGTLAEMVGEPVAVILTALVALGCMLLLWVLQPKMRAL